MESARLLQKAEKSCFNICSASVEMLYIASPCYHLDTSAECRTYAEHYFWQYCDTAMILINMLLLLRICMLGDFESFAGKFVGNYPSWV